jgi:hypothetical protein
LSSSSPSFTSIAGVIIKLIGARGEGGGVCPACVCVCPPTRPRLYDTNTGFRSDGYFTVGELRRKLCHDVVEKALMRVTLGFSTPTRTKFG